MKKKKQSKKRQSEDIDLFSIDQNEQFFFIAGYTSGGAPYGVTWEEMGLEPWQSLDDLDGDSLEVSDTEKLPFD